jgi:hypothetical protein
VPRSARSALSAGGSVHASVAAPFGGSGAPLSYCVGVGTSFTEYRGSGFWTRDAALEAVLALLVVELEPVASDDEALESVLDAWTVQAVAGFIGCVSPGLDEHLTARPSLAAAVTAALKRIRDRLPPEGASRSGRRPWLRERIGYARDTSGVRV